MSSLGFSEGMADYVRRKNLLRATAAALRELKKDSVAWNEYLEEARLFECTLMDGLEKEPFFDPVVRRSGLATRKSGKRRPH